MGACCGGQTGLWMEAWVCKMGKAFTLLIWRQISYPLCLLSDSTLPPPFPRQTHPPTHTNAVSRGQTPSRAGLTLSACCGKRWGCHSHSSLPPFPLLSFCCCRWCFASGSRPCAVWSQHPRSIQKLPGTCSPLGNFFLFPQVADYCCFKATVFHLITETL